MTEDPTILQNLGINYYHLERFWDAVPLLESHSEMVPEDAITKYFLGLSYYGEGEVSQAAECLEQAVLLSPALFRDEVERIIREANQ